MAIISGVIRGLSQNLAERGPLDTVRGPLANNKKKEKLWWIRLWMAISKPWTSKRIFPGGD